MEASLAEMFPEQESGTQLDKPVNGSDEPMPKWKPTALEMMCSRKLSLDKNVQSAGGETASTPVEQFHKFLQEDEIDINGNPLSWWRRHQPEYPQLSMLAQIGLPHRQLLHRQNGCARHQASSLSGNVRH